MITTPLQNYAVVDIEATGGTREVDRIIEVAIVLVDGHEITTCFSSLVQPGISIPPFIVKLTGISNQMVADAPPFHHIAKKIVELTEGRYLVAHNASFDYRILREEFARLGYEYKKKIIDTQRLAKTLYPTIEKFNLKALAQHFDLAQQSHHRAADDALITAELLIKLLEKSNETDGHEVKAMGLFARKSKLPLNVDEEQLLDIPNQCGIYYMLSQDGAPIYIGKSLKIRSRLRTHFQDRGAKSDQMRQMVHSFDFKLTGSELMAEIVESIEIRKHRPLLNKAKRHPSYDYGVKVTHRDGYATMHIVHRRSLKSTDAVLQWFPTRRAAKNHIRYVEDTYGISASFRADPARATRQDAALTERSQKAHNALFEDIVNTLYTKHKASFILCDKGLRPGQRAIFHVEKGQLKAMGYVDKKKWSKLSNLAGLTPIDPHAELDRRVLSYIYQGKFRDLAALD